MFLGFIMFLCGCLKPPFGFYLGFGMIFYIILRALSYEAKYTYNSYFEEEEQFLEVYEPKSMFQVEVLHSVDEIQIEDIVRIDRDSFPVGWAFSDAKEYFSEILKNKNNVRIILKNNGITVGYLLAVPHNVARKDLLEDDPLVQEDASRYYIESVAILPAYRRKNGLSEMLGVLVKELSKKEIYKISLHARISNKFSDFIQKKMKVTQIRRIDSWKYYNFEEPTDYIEAEDRNAYS
jgi:ribosomal protein S18 acetylase RimI-like enzyme